MTTCKFCNIKNPPLNLFCQSCSKILSVADANYFELLELTPSFTLDKDLLENQFHQKLALVHPDKFISYSAKEMELALECSAKITAAYATLKSKYNRASYILWLQGLTPESTTPLDEGFLLETMEWREQLNSISDHAEAALFLHTMEQIEDTAWHELQKAFTALEYPVAQVILAKIKFISRFIEELETKINNLAGI